MRESLKNVRVLIPARGGSKSIPDKNVVDVAGYPLLQYSICFAIDLFGSDRVWLSTDEEPYAELGASLGLEIPFMRPAAISQDSTDDLAVFRHALNYEEASGLDPAEAWIHLRPTTPLRSEVTALRALTEFCKAPEATSLRSVQIVKENPQKWAIDGPGPFLTTLCGDEDMDSANKPRQTLPTVYRPNGLIDIIRSSTLRANYIHGNRCLKFMTPPAIDLDTPRDLTNLLRRRNEIADFQGRYFSIASPRSTED